MISKSRVGILAISSVVISLGLFLSIVFRNHDLDHAGNSPDSGEDPAVIERTDYSPPPDTTPYLNDDRIEDKTTRFDPELVDRRAHGDWAVNSSEAVIRLDVPMIMPDRDASLLALRKSYTDAIRGNKDILASVNMIDGKAKQFDDGLIAALDQMSFEEKATGFSSRVALLKRLADKVGKSGAAAVYLAVGLRLAGVEIETDAPDKVKAKVDEFLAVEVNSKPIGVYTWTPVLEKCFRTLRYLSQPITDRETIDRLAEALKSDRDLLAWYKKEIGLESKITNPLVGRSLADVVEEKREREARIALFPPSTSRETELFQKLFPQGMPAGSNLMRELVMAIRSGRVNLEPRDNSGWYDYQVYALESLLLPEKGEAFAKLLLTQRYKKRMLDAFQALMTKRRETHARQLELTKDAPSVRQEPLGPRLRLEPAPSFYIRTARSYRFLTSVLHSEVGEETLKKIHGLREGGEREKDLESELQWMTELFYGCYLLSCEDIGWKPDLMSGETINRERCEAIATQWLESKEKDPDLAADTRVAVPIGFDPQSGKVRLWMTIGVRLARLEASYVRPPSVRPAAGGEWKQVESHLMTDQTALIPVDEFAEVEISGGRVPTRRELREICDTNKTKEKIIRAFH